MDITDEEIWAYEDRKKVQENLADARYGFTVFFLLITIGKGFPEYREVFLKNERG